MEKISAENREHRNSDFRWAVAGERGFATLVALIMVGVLTLLGIAALSTSDDEVNIAGNELQEMRAFYAAESGLERGSEVISQQYLATNKPPTTMPSGTDTLNNSAVTYNTADDGPAVQMQLSKGSLSGLYGTVKSFSVTSTANNLNDGSKAVLQEQFLVAFIPLYQFGIYFDPDLELSPTPDMDLIGRVHSNHTLYVQATNTLRFGSFLTAGESILHGVKGPGAVTTGDVQVKNPSGSYVSMKQGSGWLDHNDPQWYNTSIARWGGRVQDVAHGQVKYDVPLAGGGTNLHVLIDPYNSGANPDSYEQKASVKIINGSVFKLVGSVWSDVTGTWTTLGIMTFTADKFTDAREGKKVDVTEIDLGKMFLNVQQPANGVLYFYDQVSGAGDWPGLRLKNAATLALPLTIVSANPVYTLGNYNSVNKVPAAIIADALTCLSGTWNDLFSDSVLAKRVATNTTVNFSYVAGNRNTTSTVFNGGFENLMRLLEDWSGKTMTWRGSEVCLYQSAQATANYNPAVFASPTRNWAYDETLDDFAGLPPEPPQARGFDHLGWKEGDIAFQWK